jgi:prepilin-type N-terminal cleavage/methylation domain-containing protein
MILRAANNRIRREAFTLVEVMMAVAVVAIVFVTLFVGLAQGFSLSSAARERLRANQVALERIEGIRLVKWDDLTNTTLVPLTFTADYAPGSAMSGVVYNGTITMTTPNFGTLNPSYASAMKQIRVDVTWVSGQRTFSHSVATLVSRHGMQHYIFEN